MYSFKEDFLPNGQFIIKLVYNTGEDLKYEDPALLFQSISLEKTLLFLSRAIEESYYTEEYKSSVFGPIPEDYDNKEIKANEVRIFYVDMEYTISKKQFYDLCLLLCKMRLIGIERLQLKEKNIIDGQWMDTLQESMEKIENKLRLSANK